MKRILALGLVAMALLFAAPRAQRAIGQGSSLDRAVRDLEDTVLKMDARLERLEALASMKSPTLYNPRDKVIDDDGTARQSSAPRRVMQMDGVDTVEPDPDAYQELEQLKRDVENLERQVERQKRSVSSSMGVSGGGGGYSRSYRNNRTNRQGRAQGELLADYQDRYRQKRGEMKRLERQLKEPRQVILGNWDGKVISLTTTTDVSRVLNRIDAGGYLSWEGRRIREDIDSQEWVVTSIRVVDASDVPRH